jgi:hypothetical protein
MPINEKKKSLTITKNKLEKSKDKYKSRYLILQYRSCTWLCLMTLFIKIKFLFNQTIIEINKHMKEIE